MTEEQIQRINEIEDDYRYRMKQLGDIMVRVQDLVTCIVEFDKEYCYYCGNGDACDPYFVKTRIVNGVRDYVDYYRNTFNFQLKDKLGEIITEVITEDTKNK